METNECQSKTDLSCYTTTGQHRNKNDETCNLSLNKQKFQNISGMSCETTGMDEQKCQASVKSEEHVFLNDNICYQNTPLNPATITTTNVTFTGMCNAGQIKNRNHTLTNTADNTFTGLCNAGQIKNQNSQNIYSGRNIQTKSDMFNINPDGSYFQKSTDISDMIFNSEKQQNLITSGAENISGPSPDLIIECDVSNYRKEGRVPKFVKNNDGSSGGVIDEDLINYYSTLTRQLVMKEFDKSKSKQYICDVCGKQYSDTYSLNVHMKLHTGENLHRCDICGKMFTLSSNLTAHMRLHSGEKPFKCDECGNEYNQSGDLLRHKRTHTGERPFVCQICGKGFIRAEHCKTHQTVHTGLKLHECDVCGKTFSHIGHLRTHARIHSGDKPFHCDICGKDFTHSSDRNKHAVVHSTEKPHKCQYCDKRFGRKDCKNRHEKTHFKSQDYNNKT